MNVKNVSLVHRDLSSGRMLAPGEVAEDVEIGPHEQGQIDAGHLLAVDSLGRRRPSGASDRTSEGE